MVSPAPREQALEWLSKIARGLRGDEGIALREWLTSPTHRKALAESVVHWHGADVSALLRELLPEEMKQQQAKRIRQRRNVIVGAIAATTAAVFVIGFSNAMLDGRTLWSYVDGSHISKTMLAKTTYATAADETREVKLPDGSSLTLNADTRVLVEYTVPYRDVTVERGEASFDVAADPDWLFNIHAGKREFQSRGSRFNMRVVSKEQVDLTVTDGTVRVLFAPPRRPEGEAAERSGLSYGEANVAALEAALVEPGFQSLRRISAADLEKRLSWRTGPRGAGRNGTQ